MNPPPRPRKSQKTDCISRDVGPRSTQVIFKDTPYTLAMVPSSSRSGTSYLRIWIVSVLGLGIAALFLIDFLFEAWLDFCSIRQGYGRSANEPLGWTIAAFVSIVPFVVVAVARSVSVRLKLFCLICALIEFALWMLLLRVGDEPCRPPDPTRQRTSVVKVG